MANVSRSSVVFVAVLALAVCQTTPSIACGEPSPLVDHPRGIVVPGVRVGPLHVTTGMWLGQPHARVGWDRAEQLSKFITSRIDRFDSPVTLTGRRCEDGRLLRFAEGQPWGADASLPMAEIERRTTPSLHIDPFPPPDVQVVGELPVYGGYFIFTAPGRWLIEAKEGQRVLGSAVIEVIGPPTTR